MFVKDSQTESANSSGQVKDVNLDSIHSWWEIQELKNWSMIASCEIKDSQIETHTS